MEFSAEDIWKKIQSHAVPRPAFKAQGSISVQSASGGMELVFVSVASADTLLRVDFFTSFGLQAASLRIRGARYFLFAGNKILQGEYSDTLFRPFVHADISLPLFYCLFSGRPYVPSQEFDSLAQEKGPCTFIGRIDSTRTWRIEVEKELYHPLQCGVLQNGENVYEIRWDNYRQSIARNIELKLADGSSAKIRLKQIWENPSIHENLFSMQP